MAIGSIPGSVPWNVNFLIKVFTEKAIFTHFYLVEG